jgi:hypothetical protein
MPETPQRSYGSERKALTSMRIIVIGARMRGLAAALTLGAPASRFSFSNRRPNCARSALASRSVPTRREFYIDSGLRSRCATMECDPAKS